ncbi:unnamed protein product [Somion occarium]|uniref:Uncharacterized protein n=1 Tax=Somion occarium TaxID=3059160 RepID=A0ABP1DR88_9APHY
MVDDVDDNGSVGWADFIRPLMLNSPTTHEHACYALLCYRTSSLLGLHHYLLPYPMVGHTVSFAILIINILRHTTSLGNESLRWTMSFMAHHYPSCLWAMDVAIVMKFAHHRPAYSKLINA